MEISEKAKIFAALSDPLRLRLIELLAREGKACGKELSAALGVSVALVSHHAKLLEEAGLIARQKDGQFSRFSLNEDTFRKLRETPPLKPSDCL